METQLQTTNQDSLVPADVTPMDLQSALAGDLSRLTPEGRLKFYGAICQTVGLNPLTKPFDWLTLQGKTVLYANKGCAEQLRKIHGVTVEIIERKVEYGCLIVRVKATSKDGRSDEAIGAVPFNQNATGDTAAIAMMKCETKAKRRVTLSICGLGLLDETELEHVRENKSEIVAALNGEESAGARAEKLNAALTSGDKKEAIDISESREPASAPTPPPTENRGSQPISAPPVADVVVPPPENTKPIREPEAVQNEFKASKPSADDEFWMNVQAVLSEHPASVEYIIAQKKLERGKDIATMPRDYAEKILKNSKGFARAVANWKASAK